ncbi:cofactor assembly of complex C [Striga asiatica]|uniref:Cofactor assembly of complex C n=1 Tax=Striga asiatica TaxID=4170 RepID=A0A5A7QYU3_STRAF|nr:cofactor assembly of complex C [Striga asiatica]
MTDNTRNPLTALNDGSETFDPGDASRISSHDTEFAALDRLTQSASKRPKTLKRVGDPLDKPSPSVQQQPPDSAQEPPPRKWTFKDMVNKHRQHVEMDPDDKGKATEGDEDVTVDLSQSMPEISIAKRFFDEINKDWKNAGLSTSNLLILPSM